MDELALDMWDRVMDVNVRGTWLVTQAAKQHLAASGRGRVVNLASDTALWGAPRLLAYAASKGANWARAEAIKLHAGEEYILQIDSHMRFVPGWDALNPTLDDATIELEATRIAQALRHFSQYPVPDLMPQHVVDFLEPIKIAPEQRQLCRRARA